MLAVSSVKEAARQRVEKARHGVTWDDLRSELELYVRQKIEAGLEAIERGQVVAHEDVKKRMAARG
jgi:predicted transcriptional regulator